MLNIFLYAEIMPLITTVIIALVVLVVSEELYLYGVRLNLSGIFAIFIIQQAVLLGIGYFGLIEYTILGFLRWLWLALIIPIFICIALDTYGYVYTSVSAVLLVISLIFFVAGFFAPHQNLVYIHDMESIDINYSMPSEKVLEEFGLVNFEEYKISEAKIRKVADKNVAVYKFSAIENSEYFFDNIKYIIKDGDKYEIVNEEINFDTFYKFDKDALRMVRNEYPTLIIGEHEFDIDDNRKLYEVFVYREKFYTSNGDDYGIITIDLNDGTCKKYAADEIPDWVDFKSTEPK